MSILTRKETVHLSVVLKLHQTLIRWENTPVTSTEGRQTLQRCRLYGQGQPMKGQGHMLCHS